MITETTLEAFAALKALIERQEKPGRWLVLTHDNPDPDALASAQILARVLRQACRQEAPRGRLRAETTRRAWPRPECSSKRR